MRSYKLEKERSFGRTVVPKVMETQRSEGPPVQVPPLEGLITGGGFLTVSFGDQVQEQTVYIILEI